MVARSLSVSLAGLGRLRQHLALELMGAPAKQGDAFASLIVNADIVESGALGAAPFLGRGGQFIPEPGGQQEVDGRARRHRHPVVAVAGKSEGAVRQRENESTMAEITLKAVTEGTELTFVHSLLPDEQASRSHQDGWSGSLDKLEAYFAAGVAQ